MSDSAPVHAPGRRVLVAVLVVLALAAAGFAAAVVYVARDTDASGSRATASSGSPDDGHVAAGKRYAEELAAMDTPKLLEHSCLVDRRILKADDLFLDPAKATATFALGARAKDGSYSGTVTIAKLHTDQTFSSSVHLRHEGSGWCVHDDTIDSSLQEYWANAVQMGVRALALAEEYYHAEKGTYGADAVAVLQEGGAEVFPGLRYQAHVRGDGYCVEVAMAERRSFTASYHFARGGKPQPGGC